MSDQIRVQAVVSHDGSVLYDVTLDDVVDEYDELMRKSDLTPGMRRVVEERLSRKAERGLLAP